MYANSTTEANDDGYAARYDGFTLRSNPYSPEDDRYTAWEAGWLQADQSIRDS